MIRSACLQVIYLMLAICIHRYRRTYMNENLIVCITKARNTNLRWRVTVVTAHPVYSIRHLGCIQKKVALDSARQVPERHIGIEKVLINNRKHLHTSRSCRAKYCNLSESYLSIFQHEVV